MSSITKRNFNAIFDKEMCTFLESKGICVEQLRKAMEKKALKDLSYSVSKTDFLYEAQIKGIKNYSIVTKRQLINTLWNHVEMVDKTNLKRMKTRNSKVPTSDDEDELRLIPEPAPAPVPVTVGPYSKEDLVQMIFTYVADKKKRKQISKCVRREVWNRYIGEERGTHACFCCDITVMSQFLFEVGHVISVHNNGDLSIENLRPICSLCNKSMGTKDMLEFITEQNLPGLKNFVK